MITGELNKHSIELKNLQVGYRTPLKINEAVFGPVNVEIRHGEMVGIIGRNGIGKSTLLRTIAGLQRQLKGEILINGIANSRITVKEMAKMVSFVSTEPVYVQQIRVIELIAMGRFPHTGWLGKLNFQDKRAIHEAIEQTGVNHLLYKPVYELSDGERQKVMIARALSQDTPVIILDEPTAFLDLPARYEILRILNDLTINNDKTILFSTHDLSIALDVADRLWLMADNDIFQGAPEDLLISKVFRKLFLNSPAEFDPKTSTFRFRRELKMEVTIQGEKKYRLLTKRAMERIGFQTNEESESDILIVIHEQDGLPLWQLLYNETIFMFNSIYSLATHLKIFRKHI
jgi:iron complex transport system ATP-binding protein